LRFTIKVARQKAGDPWDVEILDPAGAQLPGGARRMQVLSADLGDYQWSFPQALTPPQALNDPKNDLAGTKSATDIANAYSSIAAGDPADGVVERFGRYLFHALIGDALWAGIVSKAPVAEGLQRIELALSWPDSEWELSRLPWEMMHDGQAFLANQPPRLVAILRLVGPSAEGEHKVNPRVLFVVGAHLKDPEIRAGAEYLGLLRRLQDVSLGLDSYVLLEATGEKIQSAVRSFQPSVVHVIAHGSFSLGPPRGVLRLFSDDKSSKTQDFHADQLIGFLNRGEEDAPDYPPIVILNACYTGAQPSSGPPRTLGPNGGLPTARQVIPLAAELARGGIPMVVAMAGKVSDFACRLFTRKFYEALLVGEPIAAAARGRRAGCYLFTNGDPANSLDWVYPTIFLRDGASLTTDTAAARLAARRMEAARQFRKNNDPAAFCDRFKFFQLYRDITSEKSARRVLAIYESRLPASGPRDQYGKSRLLEELAAYTVRGGHVPCHVTQDIDPKPKTAIELAVEIWRAAAVTRKHLGLPQVRNPDSEIVRLWQWAQGNKALALHADVADALLVSSGPADPGVVRVAIQRDLLRLRDEAGGAGVVVLFDEAQSYTDAARDLLKMLDQFGLGAPAHPIPVVFTFKKTEEYPAPFQILHNFVNQAPSFLHAYELQPFEDPLADRTIYLQFLLHLNPPLIVRTHKVTPADVDAVFEGLHEQIQGIPSRLKSDNKELLAIIKFGQRQRIFTVANDDEILERWGLV
jgi:hypothetical protein